MAEPANLTSHVDALIERCTVTKNRDAVAETVNAILRSPPGPIRQVYVIRYNRSPRSSGASAASFQMQEQFVRYGDTSLREIERAAVSRYLELAARTDTGQTPFTPEAVYDLCLDVGHLSFMRKLP